MMATYKVRQFVYDFQVSPIQQSKALYITNFFLCSAVSEKWVLQPAGKNHDHTTNFAQ